MHMLAFRFMRCLCTVLLAAVCVGAQIPIIETVGDTSGPDGKCSSFTDTKGVNTSAPILQLVLPNGAMALLRVQTC